MLTETKVRIFFKKILLPISIFYYAYPKIMYKLNVAVLFFTNWLDTFFYNDVILPIKKIRLKRCVSFCTEYIYVKYGTQCMKISFRGVANNKDVDQPGYSGSLIIAFVIHLLESIISRLATSKISIF